MRWFTNKFFITTHVVLGLCIRSTPSQVFAERAFSDSRFLNLESAGHFESPRLGTAPVQSAW